MALSEERSKKSAEFLAEAYFGSGVGKVKYGRYIARAYRDFSRTMRGIARQPGATDMRKSAENYLSDQLAVLAQSAKQPDLCDFFDKWHETTCSQLQKFYEPSLLTVGQAQKWVNMTLKYVFTAIALGLDQSLELFDFYDVAHIPIDNRILAGFSENGYTAATLDGAWSKLDNYETYMQFQHAVRAIRVYSAMDLEFRLWGSGQPKARNEDQ